jgi:hypothetical protein
MFFVSNLAGLLTSRVHLGGTLGREDSGGLLLRSSIMTTATGILCTVSFKTGRWKYGILLFSVAAAASRRSCHRDQGI